MRTPLLPSHVTQRSKFPTFVAFIFCVCFLIFCGKNNNGSKKEELALSVWGSTDDSALWQMQLHAELQRRHQSEQLREESRVYGADSQYRGVRRIKRSDLESRTLLLMGDALRSNFPQQGHRSTPKLGPTSPNIDLGPKITQPTGLINWKELALFRKPVRGERNLFVFWSGSDPGPLVQSFFGAIYRNRGEFKMFLITDENKQQYMNQKIAGKPIAPDLKTGLPLHTHISWEVYRRIMTKGKLPVAAQKDFIVNVMVAFFGGAYIDPGIIGPSRLDEMWRLMHVKVVNYVNYADGNHQDLKVLQGQAEQIAIDRDGNPKWGGDVWIDAFFTMSFAGSGMMKCWLYFAANDPNFGPLPTQVNKSLFFIYGGDIFDACFAALYDPLESQPLPEFPKGANIHLHRDLVVTKQRRDLGSVMSASQSPGRDPPNFSGRPPGFSIGGNAIIFDLKDGDPKLWANYIPESRYHELARPVYPDFKTLLELKNPTATMVQFVIDALIKDGTIYLKLYSVGGVLRDLSWEQLCGPPISFMMYLQKKVTAFDICRGRDDFDSSFLLSAGDSQHGGSSFGEKSFQINSPASSDLPQRPSSDQGVPSLDHHLLGSPDLPERPQSAPNRPKQNFWEFSPIEMPPRPSSDYAPARKPRARRVSFDKYTKPK